MLLVLVTVPVSGDVIKVIVIVSVMMMMMMIIVMKVVMMKISSLSLFSIPYLVLLYSFSIPHLSPSIFSF